MCRIAIIIILFFSAGCCRKIIVSPPTLVEINMPSLLRYIPKYDTVIVWDNCDNTNGISMKEVLNTYYLNKGKLLYKKTDKLVDKVRIGFQTKDYVQWVEVYNGSISNQISSLYYRNTVDLGISEGLEYDENGDIRYQYNNFIYVFVKTKTKDSIAYNNSKLFYKTAFNKGGIGQWRTFYYGGLDKNYQYVSGPLKEEGEVKNNFKFGEWKYYNKEGKIDSIKTYTSEDSVDVRFPHCIFNKKEPCY